MSLFCVSVRRFQAAGGLVIGAMIVFLSLWAAKAGGPPYGVPSGAMPWEWPKYLGYKEPPHGSKPAQPTSSVAQSPTKYTVRVTQIPHKHDHDDPNVAILMAHLPEDAQIWVEGTLMRQRGTIRYFESPSLKPGTEYLYTVRVQWFEDGKWVSQTHSFPIHAGAIHCIDVISTKSPDLEKEVATNLAKLETEDQKAAKEQRFCAVQEGIRLGSMGVPAKVMLKGQPVFLCCKGCVEKAQATAEQTLEKFRQMKTKKAGVPAP